MSTETESRLQTFAEGYRKPQMHPEKVRQLARRAAQNTGIEQPAMIAGDDPDTLQITPDVVD